MIGVVIGNKDFIRQIEDYFTDFSFERGGVLGIKDDVLVEFHPVENLSKERSSYIPSFEMLNDIAEDFEKRGVEFAGIIHSHAVGMCNGGSLLPSKEDLDFFKNFMEENKQFKKLLFPIITTKDDKKMIAWYSFESNHLSNEELTIL